MTVAAVVVAAGRGERFGGPKQFAPLGERTVASRSVSLCRTVADFIVLVVPENYDGDGEGADLTVTGGSTRSASVRAGLAAIGDHEIVVVHDAARPFASPSLFHSVVDAVKNGASAAVPALAVSDTIKRVAADGVTVLETLDRAELVAVQTPQGFSSSDLRRAHRDGSEATDDAALIEQLGLRTVIVPGETTNVKITEPSDLPEERP